MVTLDLSSVKQELDEAANTGLEHFQAAKQLEAEVAKLKAPDRQIDCTKACFEELRGKMNSIIHTLS